MAERECLFRPAEMLSRGNRVLLRLLLRRFSQWEPADRDWLIRRLRAAHLAAFRATPSTADTTPGATP